MLGFGDGLYYHRGMLERTLAAIGAAALTRSSPAAALGDLTIYDNAQSVPLGGWAAGMGGAYTALELTANAYVLQGMRTTGALGRGGNISAATYHSIPSIVGAVRVLKEGSARTDFDTSPNRLTFGFTVSVPRTIALKVDPPNPSALNSFAYAIREDLTVGEVGFGYQFNREVSVGVAFGGVLRTSERHSTWLLASQGNKFFTFSGDRSSLAVGGCAKVGVLVRPYKNLSFGLVLTAPSLHLFGSAKESGTFSRADGRESTAVPTRSQGSSEVGLPARVALGFAYVKRRYTFSGVVSVNFAHPVRLATA